jgi:hypothetical protein
MVGPTSLAEVPARPVGPSFWPYGLSVWPYGLSWLTVSCRPQPLLLALATPEIVDCAWVRAELTDEVPVIAD